MGDVLEHVPDRATLRKCAACCPAARSPSRADGDLPRLGLGAMAAFGRRLALREPPYHLWEVEPDTLTKLVRAAGFRVESFREAKTPPSFTKRKGPGALAVAAIDALNVPWTQATGKAGDRCTLVARP
jgi:hypothetical protein